MQRPKDTISSKEKAILSFEKPHFTSHNPVTNPIGGTDNRYLLKQKELFMKKYNKSPIF